MGETKYGKYLLKDSYKKFFQHDAFIARPGMAEGLECYVVSQGISAPLVMSPKTHKHDFAQVLCFIGGDSTNIQDFGAEIELCLGEEMEKHIITTNTAIAIPAGLFHCPITFKRVDKPVVFLEVMLTGKYEKIFVDNTRIEK